MNKAVRVTVAAAAILVAGSPAVMADVPRALTDDMSRSQLAEYALRQEYRLVPARPSTDFRFPNDAGDAVYGIDVSHHNETGKGPIDWDLMTSQKIVFVYAKATQGQGFFDGRFNRTWSALRRLRAEGREVYRGAYHFLSAMVDPEAQARNFLSRMGPLDPMDLPPCVDVEWDLAQGRDRWKDLNEDQIVERIATFIRIVEAETGRKPIIYTSRAWWSDNIPTSRRFASYPIWIADYGPRIFSQPDVPIKELKPRVMPGHSWSLWQFTEQGNVVGGGMTGKVDANLFPGNVDEFRAAFGLVPPAPTPTPPAPPPPAREPTVQVPPAPPQPPANPPSAPTAPTEGTPTPPAATPSPVEEPRKRGFFESLLPWNW